MVDVNLMDANFSDLDLNHEPAELAAARGSIEDRIRQLEAVTARQRQRQRSRQHQNPMTIVDGINNMGIAEGISERGKGFKRDRSHLVATALEMDNSVIRKKDNTKSGSFYDCNICLYIARDPVLTCCGHLFCWACFYQVWNIDSTSKECPVCKGEVSDNTVVPIYGNGGSDNRVSMTESGLMIPPRLKAHRVESVRQQKRANNGVGAPRNIHPAEAVRRVRSNAERNAESISSALSNTERLVEDLQSVINNQFSINDSNQDANAAIVPPYFLRSRSVVNRTSEGNTRDTRETRRRRLN